MSDQTLDAFHQSHCDALFRLGAKPCTCGLDSVVRRAVDAAVAEAEDAWIRIATQDVKDARSEVATLRSSLTEQSQQMTEKDKQLRIMDLSVPLEEELASKIDEMLKYLAMAQGFTLNGIAQLLVECRRRMAADWREVGNTRRELKTTREQITTLREELDRYQRAMANHLCEYEMADWLACVCDHGKGACIVCEGPGESQHFHEQLTALRDRAERAEAVITAVIDVLDKHTRALHFQQPASDHLAELIDRICDGDTRKSIENYDLARKLERAEAQVEQLTQEKAELLTTEAPAVGVSPHPIMVDRDADLRRELRAYLDTLNIHGDNIGDIRRNLFMPWDSQWNGWVRDETALREKSTSLSPVEPTPPTDACPDCGEPMTGKPRMCPKIDAARAADAAQVRERDAQIARLSEFREAVARALCVENQDGPVSDASIIQAADATLSQLFEFSAELTTLRAERDAAQQQIATLREALEGVKSTARGHLCWCDNSHNAVEHGHQPKCVAASAALQSTRPQEQP